MAGALYRSMGLVVDQQHEGLLLDAMRVGQPKRPVPFVVRWSSSAPVPMPVVVLSHGGAEGKTNPRPPLAEWATVLAGHGYMSVSIAHTPRTEPERVALTLHLGGTAPQSATFKHLGYDRPLDFGVVVAELLTRPRTLPWSANADWARVGYMGHSGGSGSVMMAAGAGREYIAGLGLSYALHPVPLAFVAMSPEGIGDDGFWPESWSGIAHPVLNCTGAGDGDTPKQRRDPFDHMNAGDKHLLWINHKGAQHTVFEGETEACVRVTKDKGICMSMQDWLSSAVLAFLDSHLRSDRTGAAYLVSGNLALVSSGLVSLTTK